MSQVLCFYRMRPIAVAEVGYLLRAGGSGIAQFAPIPRGLQSGCFDLSWGRSKRAGKKDGRV
jgi:hypothetical protein